MMIGSPLEKTCTAEINICDYLGRSKYPSVHRLYLDPLKGEKVVENPHWKQLKSALQVAAHYSGSPIMSNGGRSNLRHCKCKLRNRIYKPKASAKEDGAPCEDDCINMDRGGRCHDGRTLSKRTRTTQALASEHFCHFGFTVRWDLFGYFITTSWDGSGCPNHASHPNVDLSTLSLPMNLVPDVEKEILRSMADACIGSAVGRNYVFSKLRKFMSKAQVAYYTFSDPSRPLADGLKNPTLTVC